MFSKMSGQRVTVESEGAIPLDQILKEGVRGRSDVSALASVEHNKLCVLAWHYHDDDLPGPDAEVSLAVNNIDLPLQAAMKTRIQHFRIDQDLSNAFTAWKKMGSPQQPTEEQYAQLAQAGRLGVSKQPLQAVWIADEMASMNVKFKLPRQAVSLLVFEGTDRPQNRF
jgi:xylan 1,4-beta-xylosidase